MTRRIFDSHLHIIDERFPLKANNGYLPPQFTAHDYQRAVAELGGGARGAGGADSEVLGGVVVSGSFQAFDHGYLLDALRTLGPTFVGVANVEPTASDDDLRALAAAGVRGVRFNLYRGGSAGPESILALGQRAWDVAGMHVELYLDAADLETLEPVISSLPRASIDHFGMTDHHRHALLRLVSGGVRVKATGFGRVEVDVASTLLQIHAENPEALMFGTDLPSTRAPRPFSPRDIDLVVETLGDPQSIDAVLYRNAARFYVVDAQNS